MPLTMKLDDNEFTLSDDCLVAMATSLWRTKVKERGFSLCQNTEITPSPEHLGGQGSISVRNCPGRPRIGHYHTHPRGVSNPSWWDAYSALANSSTRHQPWLDCRGSKDDKTIRCDTVKFVPPLVDVVNLERRRQKMRYSWAEDDPEIWQYFATPYSFPVREVPEIIRPPVPVAAPRIKTEEVVYSQSRFIRYTNLDTGEVRIEQA